jgi:cell division protease FtsH
MSDRKQRTAYIADRLLAGLKRKRVMTAHERSMAAEYGMSKTLGPVAFGSRNRPRFLDVPGFEPQPFAEETAKQIDAEIKQLVVDAHGRALEILNNRRAA